MKRLFAAASSSAALCLLCIVATEVLGQSGPRIVRHVVVYERSGHFAGWPANDGAWSWGNELLVGFQIGEFLKTTDGHAIDYKKPARNILARSLDGGETWRIEQPEGLKAPPGTLVADLPVEEGKRGLMDCPGGIDFTNPNFVMTARMASVDAGQSRFYHSPDRGKTWMGPYRVPNFDQPGTAARTDYLINGRHDLTMFLTAAKSNGKEGRVICVRTRNGAKTWQMQSFVCPEPEGREYAIMPSSIRLGDGRILSAIRYSGGFIRLYSSDDDGKSWALVGQPASQMGGNPPSMVLLRDGRLVLTYGYRRTPFGIRARISKDSGKTWGEEVVLRSDGGNWDLGYPRTLVRPDGMLVTIYYFNLHADRERFIAATIWHPGA